MAIHHVTSEKARELISKKKNQRKYNLPVIGHFDNKSVRFNSILEASRMTGIHYTLIFESCLGKISSARNTIWEYENGSHYIHYKAYYLNSKNHGHSTTSYTPSS